MLLWLVEDTGTLYHPLASFPAQLQVARFPMMILWLRHDVTILGIPTSRLALLPPNRGYLDITTLDLLFRPGCFL